MARKEEVETPLWRLQSIGACRTVRLDHVQTKEDIERERKLNEAAVANSLFAAASSPVDDPSAKPLVRHVLVKDLRKVAANMRATLPATGLFANRAPIAFFAMFDGQSQAGAVSAPEAVEWCARQAHAKLLGNISSLPGVVNEKKIMEAMARSMNDLTNDLHENQHVVCSAIVVLMVSNRIFTAVHGHCGGVLCLSEGAKPVSLRGSEEVKVFPISWDKPPTAILGSTAVAQRLADDVMIKVAKEFETKPRAICGEIVAMATGAVPQDTVQCAAIAIFFRPSKATSDEFKAIDPPAAKKAKTTASMQSVRLRHILVKHRNCSELKDVVRNKVVSRSESDAETLIRAALRELLQEARERKVPADAKRAAALYMQPTPKYTKLCKEWSECASAKNAGGMIGDMGWLNEDSLQSFGPAFRDASKALEIGQWSDVVRTEHGIHILQKIA